MNFRIFSVEAVLSPVKNKLFENEKWEESVLR